MDASKKRCMVCGKIMELHRSICASCQERIRHEAMGERESTRAQSDKELKKHGVTPQGKR